MINRAIKSTSFQCLHPIASIFEKYQCFSPTLTVVSHALYVHIKGGTTASGQELNLRARATQFARQINLPTPITLPAEARMKTPQRKLHPSHFGYVGSLGKNYYLV